MNRQTIIFGAGLAVIGVAVGWGLGHIGSGNSNGDEGQKKIAYWAAPMDPSFRSEKPGKSPMGMDLIPVYEGDEADAKAGRSFVTISPAIVNNLGVRTSPVSRGDLARQIETVGFVALDEEKTSHIHVRVDGWIQRLAVKSEGERVAKGDLLFQLYSPTLVNAQAELLQASRNNQTGLVRASRERLRALDVSEAQIKALMKKGKVDDLIDIRAPQDGIVVKLNVAEGMFIQPGTTVASLADLSSIWFLVDVFEHQAEWVSTGQTAIVHLPFAPGQSWEGTVDYVYPILDPRTRTIKVRLRFDNPGEALKPNMYGDITIQSAPRQDVLSIPREAVIRTGTSEHVILALGNGRFKPAAVVTGVEAGERTEVVSGLNDGDIVVVSGQFLIDSEASLSASFGRLESTAGSSGETDHD